NAHHCFAGFWRKRDRHSPAQILEVLPVIHLRLIDNKFVPILIFFTWPARVARLGRRNVGGGSSSRRRKKRTDNDYTVKQRRVKRFHNDSVINFRLARRWHDCQ